ncbi:hypothetical protein DRW03_02490 [Corallococcus sp. H22C18031201]|nr:hypothetical protein DRW03_02490 [Corallococcus sp. H22C18031201]
MTAPVSLDDAQRVAQVRTLADAIRLALATGRNLARTATNEYRVETWRTEEDAAQAARVAVRASLREDGSLVLHASRGANEGVPPALPLVVFARGEQEAPPSGGTPMPPRASH